MLETSINKAWIAAHIPHQGDMCLLDHVSDWNAQHIICTAYSHKLFDNPLRYREQLSTGCGIEYAAQAMAVHGALMASAPEKQHQPKAGFLVSIRGATIHRARLDDIDHDLTVKATCIHSSDDNILYEFTLHAATELLLDGRAAVMLNVDRLLGATQ
jgi:predicted hotdog family 3-hydroxylacyl-ACP dehydratase